MRSFLCFLFLCGSILASENDIQFFEDNIRPVLSQQCYSCHSSTIQDAKGGLSLDFKEGLLKGGDSGPAIIPGKPDESLLLKALQHNDMQMPPDKKLPDNIIDNFKVWIQNGAVDPRSLSNKMEQAKNYWSYSPIDVISGNIDTIILEALAKNKLTPVQKANDYILIRRVYFDLIGLPPKPQDIIEYINNKDPNKYSHLLDKLLLDPRFGEKWGRHWLDIARYAESTGKDQNIVYPYAWKYRNYVIDSYNKDKSFDVFIIEQIAGDLLPYTNYKEYNEHLTATGFLAVGTKNLTENPKQYKADLIDEQIDAVTRGFLGITLSCARCHDHKFDPFTQKDYYAIYGIFQNTITLDGVDRGNNNIGYDGSLGYLVDSLSLSIFNNNKQLWNTLSDIRNINRKIGSIRSYNPNLNENDKKQVTAELEKLDKELGEKFSSIQSANIIETMLKLIFVPNPVMCVKDVSEPANAKIMLRGDVNKLGDEVPRNIPTIFQTATSIDASGTSGRMELSTWISDKNNPLTYRVHVNRIWKILFDTGIVDSFDNFGNLGGEPKNNDLLDYLAKKFIEYNYSNKKIIKEIMLSDAYTRSSDFNKDNYVKDADNVSLWRMNEKRLQAEYIRDSLFFISNELQSAKVDHTWTFNNDKRRIDGKINTEIAVSKYRSVYLPSPRDMDIESLDIFDRPDNNLLAAERNVTTVPTQALYLMNNNQILSHCDVMNKHLLESHKELSDAEKVNYLFLTYLSRQPTEKESLIIQNYINEHPDKNKVYSEIVHLLILTAEFREIK